MLDIRAWTETDVIDAMIVLDELATPAGDLATGDRIVYRRNGVIHSTEVGSVTPAGNFGPDGVTVTTVNGDTWSCSPKNSGQYRLPRPCSHPGGFRAETDEWECSRCGHRFASYEAWGAETGNMAAVDAVKGAIAADLATMTA